MVAYDFTDVPFLRTFFQTDVSVAVCLSGPLVIAIDELKVKPCFMMAASIVWSEAKSFPGDRECAMLVNPPESLGSQWFEKTTDVSPVIRDGSGSPQ